MVRLTPLLFLSSFTSAHFLLNYPATVGFNDDNEGMAPCGGFSVNYNTVTDFHVSGDSIAVQSTHPTAVWLMRATLDQTAAGNYTNLLPAVSQSSLGSFCETGLTVPASWAGQRGVIQIIQDATDGLLYQCAAVNFVTGSLTTQPSSCTNASGLTATFTTATALSAIPTVTASPASGSNSTGTSATMTSSATAAATSKAAANKEVALQGIFWGAVGVMGAAVIGGL